MRYSIGELAERIQEAERKEDLATLKQLEKCFAIRKEPAHLPFEPRISFRPEAVRDANAAFEGDVAVALANSLSRAQRRVLYVFKRRSGYQGPILVAEGDSWFEYPILLDDVLDHLMKDYAVLSLAGAGHLLLDMVAVDEFTEAIAEEGADFLLVSGGGNDMLHNGRLSEFLNPYEEGMTPEQVFRAETFEPFMNGIVQTYRDFVSRLTDRHHRLTVLCHGYDYALPRPNGKWLGGPLAGAKVPKQLWAAVVRVVIDRFNEGLRTMETLFPGRLYLADCRGTVGAAPEWYDELHPKDAGFGRAAKRFAERVGSVINAHALTGRVDERLAVPLMRPAISTVGSRSLDQIALGKGKSPSSPEVAGAIMTAQTGIPIELADLGIEQIINPSGNGDRPFPTISAPRAVIGEPKPPATAGALKAWQAQLTAEDRIAYRHYEELWARRDEPDDPETIETRRELLPRNDFFHLERIIGRSDIFPVNYLSSGQRATKAVGRINVMSPYGISLGFGTGFLVAPGLLLTNHHVLPEPTLIGKSHILFDYEFDADNSMKQTEQFALTADIFFTSKELDFTFVSVAPASKTGRQLTEFGAFVLVPESGKAIKREFVSIIQHANGLPKQIAMRDSQILGHKEQYIYYTTDTNPGSSGAPVVNDEWLPVALHHRAVPDLHKPMSYVCNRGIRISSIFGHLEAAARRHNAPAAKILHLVRPNADVTLEPATPIDFPTDGAGPEEKYVEPFHQDFDHVRRGYNPNFLGTWVPLPKLKDPRIAAKRQDNESSILTYEHFSVVVHKKRRLPLFTASNVDARPSKKKPDPDEDYSRKALGGLGKNDREKWFPDPRLSPMHQLPDRFFVSDNGAFDKGHLVRREDVTWGDTYDEIRRANGDTFHLTNCSPQVAGFNRSNLNGLWGELENIILKQAKVEKYSVFAGPVLDLSDRTFSGKDVHGTALVQIPAKYWKLVVARESGRLKSFAFLLEQDLSDVPLEFQVDAAWRTRMVSIDELQFVVRHFTFPAAVRDADQSATENNELLRTLDRYEMIETDANL